ncbi:hypothetical protein PHYPSEUDO_003238 [Phytophthora pseudosyringae]|uniref:Uncharacterized protein n=1 Tax=Phytophthora pseudosyringae TaxID=221518 RepID=A0A8T1VRV2_9STRA|nr:hypothetical protein PHYPSEUDO_003238 [Phytophthora pseudosyringae]
MERLKKQMAHCEYRNEVLRQRGEPTERNEVNKMMRNAFHAQGLSFASMVSLLTQFYRHNVTKPFDLPASLGRDPVEREAALLRMKKGRLQVAHNFMLQRELYHSTSDRAVAWGPQRHGHHHALQNFVYNLEISISEAIGDITVRENDDAVPGSPVAQHRLVATIGNVVQTDSNSVVFASYRPAGPPGSGEREMGLMIGDTVDEDELFPYRPETRIRQDMTVITSVAWDEGQHGEPIIDMTRWWCLRLRKSHIYLPPFVVERVCTGVEKVAEVMLLTAQRART